MLHATVLCGLCLYFADSQHDDAIILYIMQYYAKLVHIHRHYCHEKKIIQCYYNVL